MIYNAQQSINSFQHYTKYINDITSVTSRHWAERHTLDLAVE